jgi:HNH endonuclease
MTEESILSEDKRFCGCGCGQLLVQRYGHYIPRFVSGHSNRGRHFPHHNRTGSKSNAWKGGRHISNDGYVVIRAEGHPKAKRKGRYVFEHIIVFEQYHKCCLLPWANIHHIDHNRQNNEPSNLEGMTRAQHTKHHKTEIYALINNPDT